MNQPAAVVQMNSGDDISANLRAAEIQVKHAAARGARLVQLPECFALMQKNRRQLLAHAETAGQGPIQDALAECAAREKIWLLAGSVPLTSDDSARVYNSSLVFDASGAMVARYDKIHLFDIALESGERYAESDYTAAGRELSLVDTPVGRLGLSVCYDLRFPEMYRALVDQGAQLLSVPSAFTAATGKAHWRCLLRARAVENACYVLAAAQTGRHPSGRITHGHSVIIDPWGQIQTELPDQVGFGVADINLQMLNSVREQLPSLQHRRADLFG